MKFYTETTIWKDGGANHTYLLSDNKTKMYAYVKAGTTKVIEFKNPIDIDTRGRKFVEVRNTFKYKIPENPTVQIIIPVTTPAMNLIITHLHLQRPA